MIVSPNKLNVKGCGCELEFDLYAEFGRISTENTITRKFGLFKESQVSITIKIWGKLPPIKGDKMFQFDETPFVAVSWIDPVFDFDGLVGRTIRIEDSFAQDKNSYDTTIVLYGEMGFYDVRIKLVEKEGDQIRVRINGVVADIHGEDEWMQVQLDTIVTKS